MQTPDFVAKYGPLIHILEGGDDDLEAIAEEEGYTRRDGREWRDTHCRALLGSCEPFALTMKCCGSKHPAKQLPMHYSASCSATRKGS